MSIDPNEPVTPQHRLPIPQSLAGPSIEHRSCSSIGRIAAHFENYTTGALIVSPIGGGEISCLSEEVNITTLSDVGLIPPPPMFGGPSKTGIEEEADDETEIAGMVKPQFEEDSNITSAGLDDNLDDEDDANGSVGENECEDVSGFSSDYPMHQACAKVSAGGLNSHQGTVVGVNTRIIQVLNIIDVFKMSRY